MSGRKRQPLPPTGPRAELARRLRALRDERDLTLRELAARSGYSLASVSTAESGRRVPSWDVIAAFVQACGRDPEQWRQLWEVARSTAGPVAEPHRPAGPPAAGPPELRPAPDHETVRPSRFAGRRRSLLTVAAAVLTLVIVVVLLTMRGGGTEPPAASGPAMSSPAPPVRRTATVDLTPGEYLDLDSATDWKRGIAPDPPTHDLSFSASQHTLTSMSYALMTVLTGAHQGYQDCLSSLVGQTLAPDAVKPGVGLCLITQGGRRALATILDVHTGDSGAPDRLTLRITVWEILPDTFDPPPPAQSRYDVYACVNVGATRPDGVTVSPSGDPRLSGWESSRAVIWGAPQCPNQVWWAPYVNDGTYQPVQYSWIFTIPETAPVSCTLWAYYPPPPSGHSGGTAHYSINDGVDSSALQLAYRAVPQAEFKGSWHGLGTYPVTSGHLSITVDNSGRYSGLEQGVIAGPVRVDCASTESHGRPAAGTPTK